MKLKDELNKLESQIIEMRTLVDQYPDIMMVNYNNSNLYYTSSVNQKVIKLNFLIENVGSSTYYGIMPSFNDNNIEIYSDPYEINLFHTAYNNIYFNKYYAIMNNLKMNQIIINNAHEFVLSYIQENSFLTFDKQYLAPRIQNLLGFL